MKNINELEKIIRQELSEAKKSNKKRGRKPKQLPKRGVDGYKSDVDENPKGYKRSPAADFSNPQGKFNVLKQQGNSNMGPWTNESVGVESALSDNVEDVRIPKTESVWESLKMFSNINESIMEDLEEVGEASTPLEPLDKNTKIDHDSMQLYKLSGQQLADKLSKTILKVGYNGKFDGPEYNLLSAIEHFLKKIK